MEDENVSRASHQLQGFQGRLTKSLNCCLISEFTASLSIVSQSISVDFDSRINRSYKQWKIELVRAIFNMIVCNVALHTCGGRAFLRNNSTTAISVTVTCIIFRYSCDTRWNNNFMLHNNTALIFKRKSLSLSL